MPHLTWSIKTKCLPYNMRRRKSYLCLNENEIKSDKGNTILMKKSELINNYRYLNKYTFLWYDDTD